MEPKDAQQSPRSPKPEWALRLLLVLGSPVLFLLAFEALLRLFGYGYTPSFFAHRTIEGTRHLVDNPDYTRSFFPPHLTQESQRIAITPRKTPGTVRIFVLGASAAKGDPESAYGFAHILEAMLRTSYPDTRFEVINTAITATNSHVVLQTARECAAYDPDLFVVYLGNNEVIGPFGPASVLAPFQTNLHLIRLGILFKRTRIGQLGADLLYRATGADSIPERWDGMEMFLDSPIRRSDPRMEAVYRNFATNLRDMCTAGTHAGAEVLLCPVGVNQRDCAPFASLHRSDLTAKTNDMWERHRAAGAEAQETGAWREAVRYYSQAAAIDNSHAELAFLTARCYEELDSLPQARRLYARALELDALRFRADSHINRIIRNVARERADRNVTLVDIENAFKDNAPFGVPGNEVFYEHVHPTFAGNCMVATQLYETIRSALDRNPQREDPLAVAECAERVAFTGWNKYRIYRQLFRRMRRPPFTAQVNHEQSLSRWEEQTERLSVYRAADSIARAAQQYRRAIELSPRTDWQLHFGLAQMLLKTKTAPAQAREHFGIVAKLHPHDYQVHNGLGMLAARQGEDEKAIEHFKRAMSLTPHSAEISVNLGEAYLVVGKPDEGIEHLRRALELKPDWGYAHERLGRALESTGDTAAAAHHYARTDNSNLHLAQMHNRIGLSLARGGRPHDAIAYFREAVQAQPDHIEALNNLGIACASTGRTSEAASHFKRALAVDSTRSRIHVNLARALMQQKKYREAITHSRAALRLDLDLDAARNNLGIALLQTGHAAEAAREFEIVIASNPGDLTVHRNLLAARNRQKNLERAERFFRRMLASHPHIPELNYTLGSILINRGRRTQGIGLLRRALKLRPEFKQASVLLAEIGVK